LIGWVAWQGKPLLSIRTFSNTVCREQTQLSYNSLRGKFRIASMKINMRAAFNTATVAVISMQSVLAQTPLSEQRSSPISMDRRGILAGKQYQADGLLVTATPSGARLN
jgi:hypothetical protein